MSEHGIRALRLELAKPLDERWDVIGPLLRRLAKATPILLNAALDACIAIELAGKPAVKSALEKRAESLGLDVSVPESRDGIVYPAVNIKAAELRVWAEKKKAPLAQLEVPGGIASAVQRAASHAYGRRDQEPPRFASERVVVRAQETKLTKDGDGVVLSLTLRPRRPKEEEPKLPTVVRFAIRHSWGAHRETLDKLVSGEIKYGDCKLQWDERRSKWYALVSYELPPPERKPVDAAKVLSVHRGVRNALFMVSSGGERYVALPGWKYVGQRRKLQARMREMRSVGAPERGQGAKGHGRDRRFESHSALDDKLARATHTFCQQAAAFVVTTAIRMGCGVVLIEDYGGIQPSDNPHLRRVLDRFPLYELKQSIAHAAQKAGLTLREGPSEYVSSTCPTCAHEDVRQHNIRTNVFHCKHCKFERPADWVAAYWLLRHDGASKHIDQQLQRARMLARKEDSDGQEDEISEQAEASNAGVSAGDRGKRLRKTRSRVPKAAASG